MFKLKMFQTLGGRRNLQNAIKSFAKSYYFEGIFDNTLVEHVDWDFLDLKNKFDMSVHYMIPFKCEKHLK